MNTDVTYRDLLEMIERIEAHPRNTSGWTAHPRVVAFLVWARAHPVRAWIYGWTGLLGPKQ